MKAMIVVRVGLSDWLGLLLAIAYLLAGVGTGMACWQAYRQLSLAILAGFFWPFGLAGMAIDHVLTRSLLVETFGFMLR